MLCELMVVGKLSKILSIDDMMYEVVELSMYEFMEYFFELSYKCLCIVMVSEEFDWVIWKGVKGDLLVLVEGGNFFLMCEIEENLEVWI